MGWEQRDASGRDPAIQRGMELLGRALRRQRRRSGLTQRQLGVMTGVDQSTISKFENGRRCGLRWSRFARIVAVLDGLDFDEPPARSILGLDHQRDTPNPYLARLEAERAAAAAVDAEATEPAETAGVAAARGPAEARGTAEAAEAAEAAENMRAIVIDRG